MKLPHLLFIIFCCVSSALSYGHGFGHDTWVQLPARSWQSIETICSRALKGEIYAASYAFDLKISLNRLVKSGGQSTTNGYIRLDFDSEFGDNSQNDIVCTPTQEFYMPVTQEWMYASGLKAGDLLLSSSGELRSITYIQYVPKPLTIYTLEIEDTHNFFVGRHSILTHNMVLPVAFSIGLGMSIGSGAATGASIGSFFGPVTVAAGLAIGGMAGLLAKIVYGDKIPLYKAEINSAIDIITTHSPRSQSEIRCASIITVPTYTQNSTGCGGLTGQQRKEFGEQHLKNANELLVFDKPSGFPTLSEKEREILYGSYHTGHEAPSPLVFSLYELLTVEEAIACIKANAKNMVRGRLTKGKSNQYEIDATYEDAVEMHKELDLKNVKLKKIMGGDARVGDLDNGTAIVRERSTEGSPTIEIQDKTNPERIKETKFRCQSPNYSQGHK